jgi:hypothetical protein
VVHPALTTDDIVLWAFTSNDTTHTKSNMLLVFVPTEEYDDGQPTDLNLNLLKVKILTEMYIGS